LLHVAPVAVRHVGGASQVQVTQLPALQVPATPLLVQTEPSLRVGYEHTPAEHTPAPVHGVGGVLVHVTEAHVTQFSDASQNPVSPPLLQAELTALLVYEHTPFAHDADRHGPGVHVTVAQVLQTPL
jgi:hypothetical protein